MTNSIAISTSNLSKCYQIYQIYKAKCDRLKQFVAPRLQRLTGQTPKQYFREFWALRDISFGIIKGETVGIIRRNGSDKSTLMQMICGTLSPTSGSITTNGRCRPCWTRLGRDFILSLDFGLTRQDALADIKQCNLCVADN
jgi:lipopolysaccharide transport system ATP-binding protein